jgi:diguanylate cyclase (GGDEF)-like protein
VRSAVRLYRLIVMLAQRAQIDGLTGLYNRAHFDTRLNQEIAEARRFSTKLSLILCDLDRFKGINDTFGHPFGDRVLEVYARILLSGRMSDIACRYGGEEFAVILPRAAAAEAAGVADRFREAIAAMQWDGQPGLRITSSFGVADLSSIDQQESASLVQAADTALYQAKQAGRNRVCTAPSAEGAGETMRRTA